MQPARTGAGHVVHPPEGVWETAEADGAGDTGDVPVFGRGDQVINVIDARQSYLQKIVAAGGSVK